MIVNIKFNNPNAKLPERATPGSIGADVFSAEDVIIPAGERKLIDTGFSMSFANQFMYARLAPRSGLAAKHSVDVGAGVIDSDYRGPVKVLLINNSKKDFEVKVGDRIAQMIFESAFITRFTQVESLDDTSRGTGGFGSTGTGELVTNPNEFPTPGDTVLRSIGINYEFYDSQKRREQLSNYNL